MQAAAVGLVGDGLTLIGGFLLGLDALRKGADFKEVQSLIRAGHDPRLAKIRLVLNGVELSSESGAEKAVIRGSAWRAIWGCAALFLGFAVAACSRIMEIKW